MASGWKLQVNPHTLLTGINFFITIVKMRAPGMTWMKMPVFTWTALCSNILILATFPILTATLALLDCVVGTPSGVTAVPIQSAGRSIFGRL